MSTVIYKSINIELNDLACLLRRGDLNKALVLRQRCDRLLVQELELAAIPLGIDIIGLTYS